MNILFITAHPYLPQMTGGLQTSTDQLCGHLLKQGHRPAVLSGLMPQGDIGRVSRFKLKTNALLFSIPAARDTAMGYPVWRAWHPWDAVESVAARARPDLIVVLAAQPVRMAHAAEMCGVPLMLQLQDVEFGQHGGDMESLNHLHAIANSQFTALTYRDAFGIEADVIYPFIAAEQYVVHSSRESVTFINPHLYKGLPIALRVARACPDIPFLFVETWPLTAQERHHLQIELKGLPNVALLPPRNDMRTIYEKTKILLTPSLWNEGYGRVVTEAQISGIPVIASHRGGLPEAVGPGGILLDPEGPIEAWVAAVRRLSSDETVYAALRRAAVDHAHRPEIGWHHHNRAWDHAISTAIRKAKGEIVAQVPQSNKTPA